jgi:hypothetical protein
MNKTLIVVTVIIIFMVLSLFILSFTHGFKVKGGMKSDPSDYEILKILPNQDTMFKYGYSRAHNIPYKIGDNVMPNQELSLLSVSGNIKYFTTIHDTKIPFGIDIGETQAYEYYCTGKADNIGETYNPDGITVSSTGIILAEGDEDYCFHKKASDKNYVYKTIIYFVLINLIKMNTLLSARERNIMKDNFRKYTVKVYGYNVYGNNATLVRFAYGSKKMRDNIVYRNHFFDVIHEISEIIRYFQVLFFNCLVLMLLNPKKYQLLTIDCSRYNSEDIVANDIFKKECKNNNKLHFFNRKTTEDLFKLKGLADEARQEYIKVITATRELNQVEIRNLSDEVFYSIFTKEE